MDRTFPWVVALLVALSLSACTQFGHYRTRTISYAPEQPDPARRVTLDAEMCAAGPRPGEHPGCEDLGQTALGTRAVQHRHYRYMSDLGGEAPGNYYLAFVEFDDQGWFADRKQTEALFLLLKELEKERHVLVFVYAHGWKHNASRCDSNVLCFSRVLERMDIMERRLADTPRRVVGIYVGWRGLSLDAGPLTNLSFWERKNTAERVGRGGVAELLMRLEAYRRTRNPKREEEKTQLVIAGHSFGGLVVYSALSHALMERALRTELRPAGQTHYDTARSFGDFVVLVNPAFEGSLYEPLFSRSPLR